MFILFIYDESFNSTKYYMEASEPKWVNSLLNIIRVNSLRLGGLHIWNTFVLMFVHNFMGTIDKNI